MRACSILLALLAVSCGGDVADRRAALYDLQADGSPEAQRKLVAAVDDPEPDVRATALTLLVGTEAEGTVDRLRAALDDPDAFVRATAAKLLGDLEVRPAAPRLVELLLEDPDARVRRPVADALGRIGGDVAAEGLRRGLADPIQSVRLAAIANAVKVDAEGSKAEFTRLLLDDPIWEVRVQAARGLGRAGDPETETALRAALEDENEFVRAAAAKALRDLGFEVEAPEAAGGLPPASGGA